MTKHRIRRSLLALPLLALAAPAWAQGSYPSKPIRIVAPFAAGGAADTVARIVGPKLSVALGQPVLIENRAGAGGSIGSAQVAASPADGYTLLMNRKRSTNPSKSLSRIAHQIC